MITLNDLCEQEQKKGDGFIFYLQAAYQQTKRKETDLFFQKVKIGGHNTHFTNGQRVTKEARGHVLKKERDAH